MNTILSAIVSASTVLGGDIRTITKAPEKRRQSAAREFARNSRLTRQNHRAFAAHYKALADNAAKALAMPQKAADFERLAATNERAIALAALHEGAARSKACEV